MTYIPAPPRRKRDGSRVWTGDQVVEILKAVAESCAFQASRCAGPPSVVVRASRDAWSGVRSAAGESVSGGRYSQDGSVPGPTPEQAIRLAAKPDPTQAAMNRLSEGLVGLVDAAYKVSGAVSELVALDASEAALLVQAVEGGADCGSCKRWVAQTPSDRLRGGLCDACDHRKRRAKAKDN